MPSSVAVLALLLSVTRPPLSAVLDAERIPLPSGARTATLEASPLERRVVLRLPAAAVAAVARRLEGASRLCPIVEAGPASVTLRCPHSRIRAALDPRGAPPTLELERLTVFPWRPSEDGPPLVPFDLEGLGLGACPGERLEARGECLLAAGERAAARAAFEQAVAAGPAPLASLRLGDLALEDDRPDEAIARWRAARGHAPFGRSAQARLCELDVRCLDSTEREGVFDPAAVERPLRADLVLRAARLRALDGRLAEAARALGSESRPGGACSRATPWCRRIILLALSRPGADGVAGFEAWLELPRRTEGPLALELARAAATAIDVAGAPRWAAMLLASLTADVPAPELDAHLLRVARLFLAAKEPAHAEEIRRYAAARRGRGRARGPEWLEVERAIATASVPPSAAPASSERHPDVLAAEAAVDAARRGGDR